MVMASGWQSFYRQFEPYVAWDAVPEPMVEYIDPEFFFHDLVAL
jgi:hypothetical protein